MSIGTSQAEQDILARLASDDPDEARGAAFEAGDMELASAVDLLVRHIQSENLGVQEAAENALRRIRGAAAVAAVAPLLRSEDAPVRNSAMDILREIGSDDIKILAALLHDDDPDIRIFAADILGTSNSPVAVSILCEALEHDPEVNVRYQVCISLGSLGSADAAPALSGALRDEEWVQFAAVEALAKIRAESCVDILISALQDCSELVASTIINALGEMGNVRAVPILLQRLDTSSGPLRNTIVKASVQILGAPSLGLFAPKELATFRSYLLVALTDEDEEIVQAALTGLSGLGDVEATRAVLRLAGRLDPMREHDLLLSALHCLTAIGYNEGLREGLASGDEQIVRAAVEVCGNVGCRRCAGLLVEAFETLDRDMRRAAAHHLSRIGDKSDVSFFMELLENADDPHIIKEALHFLGVQTSCVNSSPLLLRCIEHPYDDVKEAALEACLALHDDEVNARLTGMAHDADPVRRMMAVYSMGRINAGDYLSSLEEALEDPVPDIRKVALEAIGGLCGEDPKRFELLAPRLSDESREVRLGLVELAGEVVTPESTDLLAKALDDSDDWVRIRAVESLGRRRVAKVLPELVHMLEDGELLVTLKIIEALGAIGGKTAFRALLSLTGHEDPDVQRAVAEAIAHIREEQGEDF